MREKLASDGSGVLYNFIIENDLDYVGIVEHQLKNTGSLPRLPGYFTIAKKAKQHSGGVCYYLKNKFKHFVVKPKQKQAHNILWIKFPAKSKDKKAVDLYIALVYCRTDSHPDEVNEFYAHLAHDTLMYGAFGEVIVIGDFNSRLGEYTGDKTPSGDWATNKNAPLFFSYLEATNLKLLNRSQAYGTPTFVRPSQRATSIIDFVCASPSLEPEIREFKVGILDTGHYHSHNTAITFSHPTFLPAIKPTPLPKFYFQKINDTNRKPFFAAVMELVDTKIRDPSEALINLHRAFSHAREKILKKRNRPLKIQNIPRLQKLRQNLNRFNKKVIAMRHLPADSPQVAATVGCYERIRAEYLRVEKAIQSSFFENQLTYLDKMDFMNRTKYFWRMVAKLRNDKAAAESFAIKDSDGIVSSSRQEFCENWIDFYHRLYLPNSVQSNLQKYSERLNSIRGRFSGAKHPTLDAPLQYSELKLVLKRQKNGAAPGFDHITPRMLSDGPEVLKLHFFHILKTAFETEDDFSSLKTILIKPLLKDRSGDIHDPGNFRPIALLSHLFKAYEGILNRRLVDFLEGFDAEGGPKPKLNEESNGFRPGRGCVDNLYLLRELTLDQKFTQKGKKPLISQKSKKKVHPESLRPGMPAYSVAPDVPERGPGSVLARPAQPLLEFPREGEAGRGAAHQPIQDRYGRGPRFEAGPHIIQYFFR